MADDTNPQGMENIGAIGVTIDADYSPLQAAFQQAQNDATAAGKNISDALSEGASSGADLGQQLADSLEAVPAAADDAATALGGVSEAAGHAATSEDEATTSTQDLGAAAQESGGKLGDMAEKLIAVGEALAITEGLKEFGLEALTAADNVTHASIALSHLTGDAEGVKTTLEGLEEVGTADALSMPSLYQAATRMTALLPPGTDVVALLGHIADGAAIMGTDIGSAADRFDRMASSGTANARTMTALGISLDTLAASINTVAGGTDAVASNAAAMFKALDESQRIDVLTQALSSMGGTAEKVAEQTFGGQWQQLANQWESLMVQVGQALLPVISELTDLLKIDIIPFVQALATDFNALPGPVKDAAVAVGLVTAAAVPLTAALGAFGLALSGVQNLLPAFDALMGTAAVSAEALAKAETGAAAATAELASAAAAAAPEIVTQTAAEEEGSAQLGLFTAATTEWTFSQQAATGQMELFTDGLVAMETTQAEATTAMEASGAAAAETGSIWVRIAGASGAGVLVAGIAAIVVELGVLLNAWNEQQKQQALATTEMNDAGTQAVILSGKLQQLGVDTGQLDLQYASGAISIQTYVNALIALETQSGAIITQNKALSDAAKAVAADIKNLGDSVTASQTAFKTAQTAYQQLSDSLKNGTPIYQGHAATVEMVEGAYKAMTDAATKAGISLGPIPGSMDAINQEALKLATTTGTVIDKNEIANDLWDAQIAKLQAAQTNYAAAQIKLQLLTAQVDDWTRAQNGSSTAAQGLLTAQEALAKQADVVTKAQTTLNAATDATAVSVKAASDAVSTQLLKALQDATAAVGPVLSAFMGLDTQITDIQSTMPNFGIVMTSSMTGPLVGLQSALDEATAKVAKFAAEMSSGMAVGQQYEKALKEQLAAQVALDQENAVAAAGLQGLTDKVSLAEAAYDAAKVKLDDYTQAYQTGLVTYAQVQQAQQQMTTAQTALNTAIGAGTPLVTGLTTAQQGLGPAVTSATAAIAAQTQAIAADVASVQTLSQSINSIEADMKAAFGSTDSSAGGTISAPAGYTLQVSNRGLGFDVEVVPDAATIQNQLDSEITASYGQGYTPTAIAKSFGMSVADVLSVLNLPAGAANYTKAGWAAAQSGGAASSAKSTQSGSGSTGSPVALGTNSGVLLDPLLPGGIVSTSVTGATSTGSVSSGVSSTSSSQAVDGGVYPDVTAHQAAGETWAVSVGYGNLTATSGSTSTGTTAQTQAAATTTQATTQAANVISSAVNTASEVAGSIQTIATALGTVSTNISTAATALANAATSKNVSGTLQSVMGTSSSSTTSGAAGTAGSASTTSSTGTAGGAGSKNVTSAIPGMTYVPIGGLSAAVGGVQIGAIHVDLSGANLSGQNPAQIQQGIQAAVTQGLVSSLRAAGARF